MIWVLLLALGLGFALVAGLIVWHFHYERSQLARRQASRGRAGTGD